MNQYRFLLGGLLGSMVMRMLMVVVVMVMV